jgi:hypothetical protein
MDQRHITPLERPDRYANRSILSDAEAEQLEREQADTVTERAAPSHLAKSCRVPGTA